MRLMGLMGHMRLMGLIWLMGLMGLMGCSQESGEEPVLPLPQEQSNIRREGTKAVRSRNGFAHSGYSRSPSSRKRTKLLADWDYMLVKATRTERMRIRNRLSSPAILNAPSGFQFASEDSRFLSSADSRVCLIALSVSCTPTRL